MHSRTLEPSKIKVGSRKKYSTALPILTNKPIKYKIQSSTERFTNNIDCSITSGSGTLSVDTSPSRIWYCDFYSKLLRFCSSVFELSLVAYFGYVIILSRCLLYFNSRGVKRSQKTDFSFQTRFRTLLQSFWVCTMQLPAVCSEKHQQAC